MAWMPAFTSNAPLLHLLIHIIYPHITPVYVSTCAASEQSVECLGLNILSLKRIFQIALAIILLKTVAVISGCSDGSDKRVAIHLDSPLAGIYVPSSFGIQGMPTLIGNTMAIVSPAGEAWLIMLDGPWFDDVMPQSPPFLVTGPLNIQGDQVNASMRIFPDGQLDSSPLIAKGNLVQQEYIYADYTWGEQVGQFQLTYSDLNDGSPSLDQLEGVWSITWAFAVGGDGGSFENLVVTLTIYSDGSAFGSDTTGCTYSGLFSIIGPTYNFYDLELELSSCGMRDGKYQGLAFIGPAPIPEFTWRMLYFGTSSDNQSFNARLAGPPYP